VRADTAGFGKELEAGLQGSSASGAKAGAKTGESFATGLKSKVSKVADVISSAIGVAAVGVAIESVKMATTFQTGMQTLVTGAGESQKSLGMLGKGVKSVAEQTGTLTGPLIAGLYLISSAGYKGAGGLAVLKAAAEGAKESGSDLSVTADALTTVMKDFGVGVGGSAKAMNGLLAIVSNGKTTLQLLAPSMSKVLPVAHALGVSFGSVGGAMAAMTGQGISARLAATHLSSTMLALAAPNAVAVKAMTALGLSSAQVADTMSKHGLVAALIEVQQAAEQGNPSRAVFVQRMKEMLGGATGLATGLELTGKNLKTTEADTGKVSAAFRQGGASVQGWGAFTKTFGAQLDVLKATFEVIAIDIGQKLIPVLEKMLDFFVRNKTVILIIAGVLGGLAVGITIVTKAIGLWKDATAALDLVMDANPIILIVAAVALLAAGIYELVVHCKTFRDFWEDAWRDVRQWTEDAWKFISDGWGKYLVPGLYLIVTAALYLSKHWKSIWGDIKGIAADFYNWLWEDFALKIYDFFVKTLPQWWDQTVADVKTFIIDIKNAFIGAPTWLYDAGKKLITGLWNGAENIIAGVGAWVAKIGTTIVKAVKSFFGIHSPSSVFMGIGENLMTGLFQGMVGGAAGLAKWVLKQIKGLGGSIASDVLNWLGFGSGSSSNQGDVGSSNSSAAANQAWARGELGLFGWGGGQMTPLIELWNRESGWNQNAQNPSSTAYGIAQFLDTTWAAYGPKTNNPQLQMQYGMEYIAGRYGDPAAAWAHEVNAGWYDKGGYLPPGVSLAVNRTGRREQVVPAGASNATLDDVLGALDQLIAVCAAAPGATSAGLAGALGGAGRSAAYRALYGTR